MRVAFKANDYTQEGTFESANYCFNGTLEQGWEITRNNTHYLTLGPGYRLLRSKLCGVCATDLARKFLPFPLPQIIGHEVVAVDPETGINYVVEINDTYTARGDEKMDMFCRNGLPSHSPDRMVFGIDRLPGGFGSYILAPRFAAIPINTLSPTTAVLIEPFAAALQAVISSPPANGDNIAVLGPRRLGSLLICALDCYRKSNNIDCSITALTRHDHLITLAGKMGADQTVDLRKTTEDELYEQFDIVYDTTGSMSGFETALKTARREVHLKSTNGLPFHDLHHLTELVVDELSLLPYSQSNLTFKWPSSNHENNWVYIPETMDDIETSEDMNVFKGTTNEAVQFLKGDHFKNRIPRFDLALADSIEHIDAIIRPENANQNSLLSPRKAILFKGPSGDNPLLTFLNANKSLRTSRCGDFHAAIALLEQNPDIAENMEKNIITHYFSPEQITQAFKTASQSSAIKVIIKHG